MGNGLQTAGEEAPRPALAGGLLPLCAPRGFCRPEAEPGCSDAEFQRIRQMVRGEGASGNGTASSAASRRPPFEADLVRVGPHWATLGLLVNVESHPRHLVIDSIWGPSLVSEWNEAACEDMKVSVGDHIISVNGLQLSKEEMSRVMLNTQRYQSLVLEIG
eukprot:TRINITY_DN7126_c0_g1_i1.p1 TRINITY_DN7126_c0_g1~~TRINITY_DN7126_c0_g1_i1.p1  ORF type:complete len:161 (-),score=28.08 TRINITY_DN7126_c0_g1_i1:78-560(-)